MKSGEYRTIIRKIVRNALKRNFPGLKNTNAVEELIAKNIHARMYGANVDGVDSPLWRDTELMIVTAKELLK